MTPEQKERAIELLSKDCKLRCIYYSEGKTCAIGCLAIAAGAQLFQLRKISMDRISTLPWLIKMIQAEFGLNRDQLRAIQSANDACPDLVARRQRVVDLIKKFARTTDSTQSTTLIPNES
jgi:hypothetical protein